MVFSNRLNTGHLLKDFDDKVEIIGRLRSVDQLFLLDNSVDELKLIVIIDTAYYLAIMEPIVEF